MASELDRWARDHKRRRLKELRKKRRPAIRFQRILTPRFTKDVDELRSYNMDIRGLLAESAIRAMNDEIDAGSVGTGTQAPKAKGAARKAKAHQDR